MSAHDEGEPLTHVSRETSTSSLDAAAAPASAFAETSPTAAFEPDDSTPLAREAQDHVDLARRARSTTELPRPGRTRVFVVANPSDDGVFVNLRAPVLLNPRTGAAVQVIFDDASYPLRARLGATAAP